MSTRCLLHSNTARTALLWLTLLQTLLFSVKCTANLLPCGGGGGVGSGDTQNSSVDASCTSAEMIIATPQVVSSASIRTGPQTTLSTSRALDGSVFVTTTSPTVIETTLSPYSIVTTANKELLFSITTILPSSSVQQSFTDNALIASLTPTLSSSSILVTNRRTELLSDQLVPSTTVVLSSAPSASPISQPLPNLFTQLTSSLAISSTVSESVILSSLSPSTTLSQPVVEISISPSTTISAPVVEISLSPSIVDQPVSEISLSPSTMVSQFSTITATSLRVDNALSTTSAMSSSIPTQVPSAPPTATPQPSITVLTQTTTSISSTQIASTTSPFGEVTTNQIATTRPPSRPSIFDIIGEFFKGLDPESRIGIYVGAGVVVLLLIVVCCLCCCCLCSRLRRRRKKGKVDFKGNRTSLTISNPIALVSSSHGHNGSAPARYRSTLHDSSEYSDSYNIHDLDDKPFSFPGNDYQESCIDEPEKPFNTQHSQAAHTTQPSQMTQMSTATDLFREKSLPKLSPLSYSSQLLTAPQLGSHYHSLSVDENDPHTTIGSRRPSLMAIPNTSPSLRVPTLMALSLKNEETKSAQGSKLSVHGSRTSIQGSRPSMSGSRGSVYTVTGSRSQTYSSTHSSRDHSSLQLNGPREFGGGEDDAVSLPPSSRGISPAMKQSSLEEVPTRDSPAPEIASHAVGYGKKDFASLTCIPNQYAVEVERLEEKQQLSTVPEKQVAENEEATDMESNTEVKKKPRSRTMSKLEKLTSLDYIRASLRLKKKKVSFGKTTESLPKDKGKNGNSSAPSKVKGQEPSPKHITPVHPLKDVHHSRRHSASGRAEFLPQSKTPPSSATKKYPDHYYYPQLSQPMYYGGGAPMVHGGGAPMVHPAVFYQYPQLSQQYYAQLSQGGYGGGPYPAHMAYPMESYSRSYGEPPPTSRYANMVTPELFDDTPEPEFYHERSPDNVLNQRQPNGLEDQFQSPSHSSAQAASPDQFTETSETSSYLMQPQSHLQEDPLTSAHKHFMNEFAMDRDPYMYGYGEQHHIPTYPSDMVGRPQVVPEAYREVYGGPEPGDMSHDYHMNGQQHPGYGGVAQNNVRRTSRSSYTSNTSDHAPMNGSSEADQREVGVAENAPSTSKTRVSWSTEVIEYQRTPSDLADSDFDFNQF